VSVVYERAASSDRERLLTIWCLAFPDDTAQDAQAFWDRFKHCGYVARVEGTVASMLFLIPAAVEYGETRIPVGYIYAGATHPDHRQKGLYRGLIGYALRCAASDGMQAVFLRPADKSLEESYRRMGFTVPMTRHEMTTADGETHTAMTPLDAAAYRRERLSRLRCLNVPFVDWDEQVLAHVLTWCDAVSINGAVGLSDRAQKLFPEWLGDGGYCAGSLVYTVGTTQTVGLLYPLDRSQFAAMPPIYMGYGME